MGTGESKDERRVNDDLVLLEDGEVHTHYYCELSTLHRNHLQILISLRTTELQSFGVSPNPKNVDFNNDIL